MKRAAIAGMAILGIVAVVIVMRNQPPSHPKTAEAPSVPDDETQPHSATPPSAAPAISTDQHPLPDVLIDPRITVEKERRALHVFSADAVVKTYRIALGGEPAGDKELEGDNKTPEGEFYVCTRNTESKYHRSLGLSYPDIDDADRGVASGTISKRDHRRITEAIHAYQQPPWNTALGGEIAIHGGGTDSDWTAGCIALTDTEAEELFDAIPLGTTVEILP